MNTSSNTMSQRLITFALLFSFCTGGLCALPGTAGSCPMQMGGSDGCYEVEAQVEHPCCCEIDRDATPASPSSPATTVGTTAPECMAAVLESPAAGVPGTPKLRPADRLPVKPPNLLSLHSVLRL